MAYKYTEDEKPRFVRDVVEFCRSLIDTRSKGGSLVMKIGDEEWRIYIEINRTVCTYATVSVSGGRPIRYPFEGMTTWGGDGNRWDHELREFLEREVLKK